MKSVARMSALIVSTSIASAQVVVPDDFATLQQALDASPPDSVIIVNDVTSVAISISKPVTIIGNPSCYVTPNGSDCGSFPPLLCPGVTLNGTGVGDVTLVNVEMAGSWVPGTKKGAWPMITGFGFEALTLISSDVQGTSGGGNSYALGSPAISVDVDHVAIVDSVVTAGETVFASFDTFEPVAQIAIVADTVTLIDSTVVGGTFTGPFQVDCPTLCDDVLGGRGGLAIKADRLFTSGSTITGGQGLSVNCTMGGGFVCQMPMGDATDVSETIALGDFPTSDGPLAIGAPWTVSWNTASSPSLLLASTDSIAPQQISAGWLFVNPATPLISPISAGAGSATTNVPLDTTLVGVTFTIQTYDPVGGLSRPLFTAVTP